MGEISPTLALSIWRTYMSKKKKKKPHYNPPASVATEEANDVASVDEVVESTEESVAVENEVASEAVSTEVEEASVASEETDVTESSADATEESAAIDEAAPSETEDEATAAITEEAVCEAVEYEAVTEEDACVCTEEEAVEEVEEVATEAGISEEETEEMPEEATEETTEEATAEAIEETVETAGETAEEEVTEEVAEETAEASTEEVEASAEEAETIEEVTEASTEEAVEDTSTEESTEEETEEGTTEEAAEDAATHEKTPEEIAEENARAEEAARLAREKAEKKAAAKAKRKAWCKRHVGLIVFLCLIVLLGAGLATGHFVTTRNVAFIHKVEDLEKAVAAGKKTEYIFKSDINYEGSLTLTGVSLDMNDYTLTVRDDLFMSGDVFVGSKKTIWHRPQVGGAVIVGGTYSQTGNVRWYSALEANTVKVTGDLAVATDFDTKGLNVSGALDVDGNVKANEVTVGGDLTVAGVIKAPVTISANADISGTVQSILGGKKVVVKGTVGDVVDSESLYLYPDSNVTTFAVGAYYFVQYLETPTVLVKKVDGTQMLLISHVHNADGYKVTIDSTSLEYDVRRDLEAANTAYVMPNLDPGDYNVTVVPYSDTPDVYISGSSAKIKLSYYVQLATPVVTIDEVSAEETVKVIVSIEKVDFASNFIVNVAGTDVTVKAEDGVTTCDITDKIKNVGSYDVYVYAEPPKKGNYERSETTLVTYVRMATATATVNPVIVENGIDVVITGTDAYYYLVEWKKGDVTVSSVSVKANSGETVAHTDLTSADVDAVCVTPLAKGYYRTGEVVKVAVTQPQPATDGGEASGDSASSGEASAE